MHRYDNVKYNGFNLSEVCDIEEIRLPILPSNKISTLDIASRDGEIYNGKKYESYVIEIDILIDCDTKEELNEKLKDIRDIFDNGRVFFATLGYASDVKVQADKSGIPDDAVSTVIPGAVIYIPFAELVDIDKEIERLNKEKDKLHKEIARCNGMLNNEKFTSKAPQAKIDEEKAKLEKYSDMLAQVEERLKTLSK